MRTAKAHAAGIGGGLGAAIAAVAVNMWPDLQPEWAVAVICSALLGWGATYFGPANR